MRRVKTLITVILTGLVFIQCYRKPTTYFEIKSDEVVEGVFHAWAPSPNELFSTYPLNQQRALPQPIAYKLSLNGRDNEAPVGANHLLVVPPGIKEFYLPEIKFGEPPLPLRSTPDSLREEVKVHFRVNLKPILKAFARSGFFVTATGDTVTSRDFKGVFLAGDTSPLTWGWGSPETLIKLTDEDGDSIFTATVEFAPPKPRNERRQWRREDLSADIPRFFSPQAPLLEALYNLAVDEARANIGPDGTFAAGAEWPQVWVRDIGYASFLGLAYLFPTNVKLTLLRGLTNSRIRQDPGTGGSWPVSTDRYAWVLGAWEYFLATGDSTWLEQIKPPLINSLNEDFNWNRDAHTALLRGETSFLDWREQTYPIWLNPAGIHASQAFSSNLLFMNAMRLAALLLPSQHPAAEVWAKRASLYENGLLGMFWSEDLKAPAAYRLAYPLTMGAPQRDALAEALYVLLTSDTTKVMKYMLASYPRTPYGTPVISPQVENIPAYHNRAVWPFVEALQLLAAKRLENQKVYRHSFRALVRAAALFLSHRENFEAQTGRPDLTQVNSERQLWSIAGWIGAVYKGLFGLRIVRLPEEGQYGLLLAPDNPWPWDEFKLKGLKLQRATCDIELHGSGANIEKMEVNGSPWNPSRPLALTDTTYRIKVYLKKFNSNTLDSINLAYPVAPPPPVFTISEDTLVFRSQVDRVLLRLNGMVIDTISTQEYLLPDSLVGFMVLQQLGPGGVLSRPTAPIYHGPGAYLPIKGSKGQGPLVLEPQGEELELTFKSKTAGDYLLRWYYENPSSSYSTGEKCGLAMMRVNSAPEDLVVFPATGQLPFDAKTAWYSVKLKAGDNRLRLKIKDLPVDNMSGELVSLRIKGLEILPDI